MTPTRPIVERRNLIENGNLLYINIPVAWLKAYNITKKHYKSLLITDDKEGNLKIMNPRNEAGVFMKAQLSEKLTNIESEIPTTTNQQPQRREA